MVDKKLSVKKRSANDFVKNWSCCAVFWVESMLRPIQEIATTIGVHDECN